MLEAESQTPDISLTYGAFEVGILMVMFLTGIATLQIWNVGYIFVAPSLWVRDIAQYFRDYNDDPKFVRLIVVFVYGADIFHTALLCHALYHYTIVSFGRFEVLGKIVWSLQITIPMAGVVAFIVHTYFCIRIQRITSGTAAVVCWILALVRLILDSILAREVAGGSFEILKGKRTKTLGLVALVVGAVSDVLIAGFLCLGLLRARSGFERTDKLLDKLVAYTIGSGLLTSVVALCETITFGALSNFVFLAFYCILPKLFSNSLLASLNERNYTRRDLMNKSFNLSQIRSSRKRKQAKDSGSQGFTFERTTEVGVDLSTTADQTSYFTESAKVATAV